MTTMVAPEAFAGGPATIAPATPTPTPTDIELARRSVVVDGAAGEELPICVGSDLGRYVVMEKLGSGGMCDVFAGYDRDLARKVAIKIVRGSNWGASSIESQRLMREAQTMAQLSHPNVVTVFEIGVVHDKPFVAMEYVPGETLRDWMQRPHRWQETVEMFCKAGEGLIAAHEKGVIHRDFKPDNVLLGDKGRVQVTDFGLAQMIRGELDFNLDADDVITFATQHGRVFGTPAYMAPEQMRGDPADPLADQFCFCVALYEALYGKLPFSGRKVKHRYEQIENRQIEPPPKDTAVPRRIHRLVLRGFEPDPQRRHESMSVLLRELRRALTAGRRRLIAAIAITAAVGATFSIGGLLVGSGQADSVCRDAGSRWSGVWNEHIKNSARAAFSELENGDQVWKQLEPLLDGYASRWQSTYTENCRATRVDHSQSNHIYALRNECLEQGRREVEALVGLLVHPTPAMVTDALPAAYVLTDVVHCSPALVGFSVDVAKGDPAAREKIQKELALAKALFDVGQFEKSLGSARTAAAEADKAGFGDLAVVGLHIVGKSQWRTDKLQEAEETLVEAAARATSTGQSWVRSECLIDLVYVVGVERAELRQARQWYQMASYTIKSLGDPKILRGQLYENMAIVMADLGDRQEALELSRQAFHDLTEALPAKDARLGSAYNNWGNALYFAGDMRLALANYQEALEIRTATLHPRHPDVAESLNNIANVYQQMGMTDEAIEMHRRGLDIYSHAGGQQREVAKSLANIGAVLLDAGKPEEALKYFEQALAIDRQLRGQNHPFVAMTLLSVGSAHEEMGQEARALAAYREAVATVERSDTPNVPLRATALATLGRLLVASGRTQAGIESLEAAHRFYSDQQSNGRGAACCDAADASFELARALLPGDPVRARQLAQDALTAFASAGGEWEERRKEVAAWLAATRSRKAAIRRTGVRPVHPMR